MWFLVSGSVKLRQRKERRLKVLHAPESQRGLLGKAGVKVVVRNHHHLHPRSQSCLHAIRSVFKHQALSKDKGEGDKVILSYKPIRSTGFHPCRRCTAETKNKQGENGFPFLYFIFLRGVLFTCAGWNTHSIYLLRNGGPAAPLHWLCFQPLHYGSVW